jgi:Ciliary basal body-associated, B9 protein
MPDVHFIGEIQYVTVDSFSQVSLTFAFVPGSLAWYLKGGACHGETHTAIRGEQDCLTLNYPLDAHYDASSAEGWPFFVCEVRKSSKNTVVTEKFPCFLSTHR